jgi:hypothetical protein
MMNEQVMPKIGGKSFRCDCGCNVFTKIGEYRYRCNACRIEYQGEPEQKIKSLAERIQTWRSSPIDVDEGTMILEADGIIYDLEAERDAVCGIFGDYDVSPTLEQCREIWNDIMEERRQLRNFKKKVYEAYTPNSHYNPNKLEALLIAHMYEE